MRTTAIIVLMLLASGCVSDPYHFGISKHELLPRLPRTPNLITVGGNHPTIDSIERTVKYPGRVLSKWFRSTDPEEQIPADVRQLKVVQTASDYLDENGLKGVYIDIREYNPKEQWNRLMNNERVSLPFGNTQAEHFIMLAIVSCQVEH